MSDREVHERIMDGIKRRVDRHWRFTKNLLRIKPEYYLASTRARQRSKRILSDCRNSSLRTAGIAHAGAVFSRSQRRRTEASGLSSNSTPRRTSKSFIRNVWRRRKTLGLGSLSIRRTASRLVTQWFSRPPEHFACLVRRPIFLKG